MDKKGNKKGKGKQKKEKNYCSEIKTLEQYKAKGKEINKKYVVFTDISPIMLPPAPKQTYIDLYADEEGASSSKLENEKRLQANYKTEVKVYRALEGLDEKILVLHGFDYSHHQYRLCDTSHDRASCNKCEKEAANVEGECDFIVIGKNYFLIIEVKNISHKDYTDISEDKKREIAGALTKSRKQSEKVKVLIEIIAKGSGLEKCQILQFSAFPSYTGYDLISDLDCNNQIICREHFLDFDNWWWNNEAKIVIANGETDDDLAKHEEVKEVLLAIWCTEKNRCDELKCSLRQYSEIKTMGQYKAKGKEINEKYCVFADVSPIMLPPAPKQTYIDLYVDEEGASSSKFENEKRLQANYEAEVKVYRALERLDEKILVLHGFEYSHHQYRLCDTDHARKNCVKCKNAANKEAECDFIVIGRNYFVVIEVKNIPHDKDTGITDAKKREIVGALTKSREQSKKVKVLIESISKGTGSVMCQILQFSAFPSTGHDLLSDVDCRNQIICKEDFFDFRNWWQDNVAGKVIANNETNVDLAKHEEVKEVLLAIWCTEKNICDDSKCSLGKCITDIDEELRKGKITFSSRNRTPNPNVIKVTDIESANIDTNTNIFRDYIGVDNLTAEQCDAFNSDQSLLVINGPAGSGKTIILLAKIIQLIKTDDENRVLLFTFTKRKQQMLRPPWSRHYCGAYQTVLERANIGHEMLNREHCDNLMFYSDESPDETCEMLETILKSMQNHRVVIANITLENTLDVGLDLWEWEIRKLGDKICKKTHVFVDDLQAQMYETDRPGDLYEIFAKLSATNRIWIAYDRTQISVLTRDIALVWGCNREDVSYQPFIKHVPPENVAILSLNLRNTYELAEILSIVRKHLIKQSLETDLNQINALFPVLRPGHLIHGPRVVVHVFENKVDEDDLSLIDKIALVELDKLLGAVSDRSCRFKIGIIRTGACPSPFMIGLQLHELNTLMKTSDWIDYFKCDATYCYSSEYPALIVIMEAEFEERGWGDAITIGWSKTPLYLLLSRARVYCSLILYTTSRNTLSEHAPLYDLVNELEDADEKVKIIRYDHVIIEGVAEQRRKDFNKSLEQHYKFLKFFEQWRNERQSRHPGDDMPLNSCKFPFFALQFFDAPNNFFVRRPP